MDEAELRQCRKCLLMQSGKEDILSDIYKRIANIPSDKKTDEKEYSVRLSVCSDCDHLISGCCNKCGCYPEFRAAFIDNRCPCHKW